jgi:hypothetical protein
MKAQMFLLAAIILVTGVTLSLSFKPNVQMQKKLITHFNKEILENVANELNNAVIFSYNNPDSMIINAFDFANFTKKKMREHAFDLKLFFVLIVENVSTGKMNITALNLMGEKINVSLQLNSSPPQSASITDLSDYGQWSTDFSIEENTDYSLSIAYSKNSRNITIQVKTSDLCTTYFDLIIESEDTLLRRVFERTYNF